MSEKNKNNKRGGKEKNKAGLIVYDYNNLGGRGKTNLTKEIASAILHNIRTGVPVTKKFDENTNVRILNIDGVTIRASKLDDWVKYKTCPRGMKTPLVDMMKKAKERYYVLAREKRLRMAEKVFDEDLNMDTTVTMTKKVPKMVEKTDKDGKTKYKIEQVVEEIEVISPKLRKIRSETAMFVATHIGKDTYNTNNINIEGDNNTVNINTISLLQVRERAQERSQEQTDGNDEVEGDTLLEAEADIISTGELAIN